MHVHQRAELNMTQECVGSVQNMLVDWGTKVRCDGAGTELNTLLGKCPCEMGFAFLFHAADYLGDKMRFSVGERENQADDCYYSWSITTPCKTKTNCSGIQSLTRFQNLPNLYWNMWLCLKQVRCFQKQILTCLLAPLKTMCIQFLKDCNYFT